ncbi:MAG: class I SAM-dependent methyltransferase [Saprospiraceae bacterium]|nr:class I SAM-dependent methyltransferase [Saprospiraceae bacterium]
MEACRQFPENAQILDAGCGDGRYIRNLKKYGYNRVTGIDLFDSLSDKSINYLCGDVNNLPFRDESFEVLYDSVINYSQYPEKTLRGMEK